MQQGIPLKPRGKKIEGEKKKKKVLKDSGHSQTKSGQATLRLQFQLGSNSL